MTQDPSAKWIGVMIGRELATLDAELALCADDAMVWATLPGVTNPIGTLTLHVCGNLQYFVGALLGGTGYVRDRPREFAARGLSRSELQQELLVTRDVVRAVMATVTDDRLAHEYPEPVGGVRMRTGAFLTHLVAHTALHLGQAGYLRRALSGSNQSAGPAPLTPLAGL